MRLAVGNISRPAPMNVLLHALTGVAIAHAAVRLANVRDQKPSTAVVASAALAGVLSHGLLDWLRHSYPVPSRMDVVLALTLSVAWLLSIRRLLLPLFALALTASFLPDVIDHLPRLLHVTSPLPTPLFPWHAPEWSGSLYPATTIRAGSRLVALELGDNRAASLANHVGVILMSAACVFLGRSAFRRRQEGPSW